MTLRKKKNNLSLDRHIFLMQIKVDLDHPVLFVTFYIGEIIFMTKITIYLYKYGKTIFHPLKMHAWEWSMCYQLIECKK